MNRVLRGISSRSSSPGGGFPPQTPWSRFARVFVGLYSFVYPFVNQLSCYHSLDVRVIRVIRRHERSETRGVWGDRPQENSISVPASQGSRYLWVNQSVSSFATHGLISYLQSTERREPQEVWGRNAQHTKGP